MNMKNIVVFTSNIVLRRPIASVTMPDRRLPMGCITNETLAEKFYRIFTFSLYEKRIFLFIPIQEASEAVTESVSSGLSALLMPSREGTTIAGKATVNPKSQINRFFAELAKN